MAQAMFIEIWTALRDLMGDNNTPTDIYDAKRFINWTIRDLSQQYDWEFLRGEQQLTASSGSGVYDLSNIIQITATAETLYVQTDASADNGAIVSIYGKQIGASSSLNISSDNLTIVATATASGAINFSNIDSIRKAVTTGNITITDSNSTVLATLSPSDTYVANDIRKINYITNNTKNVRVYPYDVVNYEKGNPNNQNAGVTSGYDLTHEGKLQLFNVDVGTSLSIFYQRVPRWLVNNSDRTEFPEVFISKIANAAYEGYGLRYRDQADANFGKQRYDELLRQIVADWLKGKDSPSRQVLPNWYTRRL